MTSGTTFKTTVDIETPTNVLIEAGTKAMVIAVEREAEPAIYLCETLENPHFEVDEFWCYTDQMILVDKIAY